MGFGKSKTPKAPDYAGLAEQQGEQNRQTAGYNTNLNRVNQTGPSGSVMWSLRPGADPNNPQPGDYVQNTALSDSGQRQYDSGNQAMESLLGGMGNLGQFNTQGLPQLGQADDASRQRVEQAMMSRMQPQFDQDRERATTGLLNSGIEKGSTAYDSEMRRLDQSQNDARMQSVLAGGQEESRQIGLNNATRGQGVQEQGYMQQLPVNMLTALQGGGQSIMPNYSNYYTGGQAQAAPTFDAGLAQGNYKLQAGQSAQSGQNALMGGLAGLGGAAIQRWSDRRLKSNIVRIGKTESGFNLYRYTIFGWPEVGVMADEVQVTRPDLVHRHNSGYYQVDYSGV